MAMTTACAQQLSNITDKGAVINGVRWATRNVAVPGTFADKTEDAGIFYQWNRKQAWNATDSIVVGWDNTYFFCFDSDAVGWNFYYYRGYGFSVRCVAE